jgi:hypothetical protein
MQDGSGGEDSRNCSDNSLLSEVLSSRPRNLDLHKLAIKELPHGIESTSFALERLP